MAAGTPANAARHVLARTGEAEREHPQAEHRQDRQHATHNEQGGGGEARPPARGVAQPRHGGPDRPRELGEQARHTSVPGGVRGGVAHDGPQRRDEPVVASPCSSRSLGHSVIPFAEVRRSPAAAHTKAAGRWDRRARRLRRMARRWGDSRRQTLNATFRNMVPRRAPAPPQPHWRHWSGRSCGRWRDSLRPMVRRLRAGPDVRRHGPARPWRGVATQRPSSYEPSRHSPRVAVVRGGGTHRLALPF
jgi:hypothetical protein